LLALAREQGQTPDAVIESLVTQQAQTRSPMDGVQAEGRHYYTTDDWFRHLGMTEDEIRTAKEEAEADNDADP
jgi:hypothetical protein